MASVPVTSCDRRLGGRFNSATTSRSPSRLNELVQGRSADCHTNAKALGGDRQSQMTVASEQAGNHWIARGVVGEPSRWYA